MIECKIHGLQESIAAEKCLCCLTEEDISTYKNRFGFVEVDIENSLNSQIKKSGRWFKTMLENNGLCIALMNNNRLRLLLGK
ncbi:family 1 glycosylhydrolase [Psychromonas aquimarina]|uniref:family 1 glycosylhydrolase n=1 Tax=Psychromonas aquimarina TaxID=444919 RepID=UPI00049018AC